MIKRWNLVVVMIFVTLLLSGCLTPPQQGEPGGEAPTVLVIWHSFAGNELKALEGQIQRIIDNHPEVIVKAEYISENKMVNNAYYAQAGGKGPDIVIAKAPILNQLYTKGGLAPFAGTVQDDYSAASSLFKIGEMYFAKAWVTDVPLLFYRKDLLPAPPTTFAELFMAEDKKLKPVLAISKLSVSYLSPFWSAAGGSVYSQGRPNLDSPANLEFAKLLQTLATSKQLVVSPEAVDLFVKGEAHYLIDNATRSFDLSRKKVQWAAMPLTRLTGENKTILMGETIGVANSAIKSDPKRFAQIALVEDELLSPETEGALHKANRRLPASSAYYLREEAKGAYYKEVSTSLSHGWVLPNNAWERKLFPVMDESWNNIVIGGAEPEEALKQAQNKGISILESLK